VFCLDILWIVYLLHSVIRKIYVIFKIYVMLLKEAAVSKPPITGMCLYIYIDIDV
jgi:hypothetical protein